MTVSSLNKIDNREACGHFSRLLVFPVGGISGVLEEITSMLINVVPDAATELKVFKDVIEELPEAKLEEAYTRAFDLAPQSIPFLSVYLFGEESYKRSELMSGLLGAYEKSGYQHDNELPDHLRIVLGYAPHCDSEEWDMLVHWCIPGPLGEMVRGLERGNNPYVHLLRALVSVFKAHYPQEFCHV